VRAAACWHFQNKQELLDEMARAMIRTAIRDHTDPPTGDSWEDRLAQLAHAQRRAMRSHRDGPLLLLAARPNADYQLAYLDEFVERLVKAGLTAKQAGDAFAAVSNYALGTAIVERHSAQADRNDLHRQARGHPGVAAIAESSTDTEASFEQGLQWLIGGVRENLSDPPYPRPTGLPEHGSDQ
jgi:TetR/AcrR family transcriptional regulator, tetracycline repressor protein